MNEKIEAEDMQWLISECKMLAEMTIEEFMFIYGHDEGWTSK